MRKNGGLMVFAFVVLLSACSTTPIESSTYQEGTKTSVLASSSIESVNSYEEKPSESSSEQNTSIEEPSIESSEQSSIESSSITSSESSEPVKTEPGVGDVIKSWSSTTDYNGLIMETPNSYEHGRGYRQVFNGFGRDDECSLSYDLYCGDDNTGYITTSAAKTQYFTKSDITNGYIVSLYYYVVKNGNVDSFQLQAVSENYADEIYGQKVTVNSDDEEQWKRVTVSFDTIDDFKSLRLLYTVKDNTKTAGFLIDDIEVTIGTPAATDKREAKTESLYKKYEDDFKIGTCLSSYSLNSTSLKNLTKQHFNSITPENEGKPEQILSQAGCQALLSKNVAGISIKTTPYESIYKFAESNHMKVRHHTLVWHSQTPDWFFTKDYTDTGELVSKEIMLMRMENYIQVTLDAINDKYPGLVYAIDVANEAIEYGTVRKNKNKWYDTIGSDYVYYALKFAKRYKAPWQDLYYNDYSYDFVSNNCTYALNTLLKKAIDEKLVDGVGIQGHLLATANMDTIIKDAKMIYQKGLKCQITELDIGISDTEEASYEKQRAAYSSLITKILKAHKNKEANINAIVLWGVSDNYSWRNDEYPLLFDSSYQNKPAYYAFYNAKENI